MTSDQLRLLFITTDWSIILAKKKTSSLLGILRGMVGNNPSKETKSKLGTDTELSISTREREVIVRRIFDATQSPARRGTDPQTRYILPLARRIASTRLDAEAIETLAPEVKTAKEIVIPSIISPSDMRDGEIAIQSTSKLLTDAQNDNITKLLSEHFNGHLKLSDKIPRWIHEGLYGAGSQPVMVLPVTEIDTIISDPTAIMSQVPLRGATEGLDLEKSVTRIELSSIFGIADSAHTATKNTQLEVKPAVESLVSSYIKTTPDLPEETRSYDFGKHWPNISKELQGFAKQAVEQLNIADNPDMLKIDRARKSKKTAELTQKIATIYKTKTLITINPETKPSLGDPIVYELPPESVIPIFTPGTPTDHIGYFIVLDEFGNPVHLSADGPVLDMTDSNRAVTPAGLYKSFGFDGTQSIKSSQMRMEQSELMMGVYQTIVEAHLKSRLKNSGLGNIYIGAPSSVYRCMFARYLALRKTRLLFVPKDLVTYICFRHNKDGTGRSKIEDIKFLLSLKITILVCRVMAAMNSSINRRKLTVNFTEHMGDPIAFFQQLEKEAIDKSIMNFTYDPTEITRTLAQRSLTVSAKNIPGAENYDITTEPNESRDIRPDETLIENIDHMIGLSLDVPPSALNMLNENEYSRTVATNNLFFSRRISAYQKCFCAHIASHAQTYTHMSETLKTAIRKVISAKSDDGAAEARDAGTVDDKPSKVDAILTDVIKNIIAVLPAPNIAPSKTEFEELDTIINSINTTLEAVFDNDLGSVDDNPIATIRALVKESVIRDYMTKIGVMRDVDIPDIASPGFLDKIHNHKLTMINLSKGLKAAVAVTQPPDAMDVSPGGAPPQSF